MQRMVTITIRDVPEDARDALVARAARSGRSLEEYLRAHLVEVAARPDPGDMVGRARERVEHTGSRLSTERIHAHRDAAVGDRGRRAELDRRAYLARPEVEDHAWGDAEAQGQP